VSAFIAEHALPNWFYSAYNPYTAFLPQKVWTRSFQTICFPYKIDLWGIWIQHQIEVCTPK